MPEMVQLTDNNFDDVVLKSDKPVLVDFSATWCGPCQRLNPVIKQIADEYDGKAVVCHLDVDDAPKTARKYQVMSVPTCLFFKNGEAKDISIGLVPKDLLTQKLDDLL
jgi:thioredoxin 1